MEDLNAVVERFRRSSVEQTDAGRVAAGDLTKPENIVAATVGLIRGSMFGALADVLEQMSYTANASSGVIGQAKLLRARYNSALRTAFAKADSTGDFTEYDKLVNGGLSEFEKPTTPTS